MTEPPEHDSSDESATYDPKNLTLLEHLEELRRRLLTSFGAIALGIFIGLFIAPWFLDILTRPMVDSGLLRRDEAVTVARIEVLEGGGLSLRNASELVPSIHDGTTSESVSLSSLEFFQPGAGEPFAVSLPARPSGLIYLRPTDPFLVYLKASLVIGIVFALPVILYQVYAFIAPGLLPRERRWAGPCYAAAIILFPVGATFAYFILKYALMFFAQFISADTYLFNDVRAYLSFALTTMLAFGFVFELPIAVLLATRTGLVTVDTLAAKRRVIFVAILIISAVVTPTGDPVTLMAMSLPLYLLFEVALVVSRIADRAAAKHEAREPEA